MMRVARLAGLMTLLPSALGCSGSHGIPGDGGGMDGADAGDGIVDSPMPDGLVDSTPSPDAGPDSGALCARVGEACREATDCCSYTCVAGVCASLGGECDPMGEACASDTACCSLHCASEDGSCPGPGGDCRCALATPCHPYHEICSADEECCSGYCIRGPEDPIGRCVSVDQCRPIGEACSTTGRNGSCCSELCVGIGATDVGRCHPSGGCLAQDDVCRDDEECCSGLCGRGETLADGRTVYRCLAATPCIPLGEVCGSGATTACCPPMSGSPDNCLWDSSTGIPRCRGGSADCARLTDPCTSTSDCCTDVSPETTCAAGPDGTSVCCLPAGEPCAFGDLCCGGVCAPDETGTLRCQSSCVADGARCTIAADCCGCACLRDGGGALRCSNDPDDCAPCVTIGDACDVNEDCCDWSPFARVYCGAGTCRVE